MILLVHLNLEMKVIDKVMVMDLETENHEFFGRFASPRHPDNYVVMLGWCIDSPEGLGEIQYTHYKSKDEAKEWLNIPDDVWLIVCHNASFEIEWMHTQQPEVLHAFLKRGGMFFCTSTAEYLLSGQQHTYPSLDEVAPRYGGTTKIDEVKLLWDQGYLTSEIDPELLAEYLAGEGGDIANTRKAYMGQWDALESKDMLEMFFLRMDALVFNAMSEANGLKVDREVAFADKDRLESEIQEILDSFKEYQAGFPKELDFNFSSHHHKSAWIFGGPFKYRARVPRFDKEGKPVYVKYDCVTAVDPEANDAFPVDATDLTDEEVEEWAKSEGLELARITRGKNAGKIRRTRENSDVQDEVWGELLYQWEGLVNFDDLDPGFVEEFKRSNTTSLKLADETPVYSTGGKAIEALALRQELKGKSKEIIQGLARYASLDKDLGSFYLKQRLDDDGNVARESGALQYLTDDDFIHHKLNNTSVVTTRLSSSSPNMQQLPQGSKSNVKAMFVSRFGDDGLILEADYSNLEVIVLAALSGDDKLAEFILSGRSMHTLNAANALGIAYEEFDAVLKDRNHPDNARYDLLRELAKPKEFAANYGATAAGIAYAAGCTVQEGQEFLDAKARQFPKVAEFHNRVYEEVCNNTTSSREMMDDGTYRIIKTGTYKAISGTEFKFKQSPRTIYYEGKRVQSFDFRMQEIKNYPTQGEASFFVQAACGWVMRWLVEEDFYGGLAVPINTVHDAIYIDCHKSVLKEVAETLKEIMESIPEGVAHLGYELDLPFPVDVTAGPNLLDQVSYKEFLNDE